MRPLVTIAAVLIALVLGAPSAYAETDSASGTFQMTTAPGILPAWEADDIAIIGIYPGSVTTRRYASNASIMLPVVAQVRTAHATAGGFRIVNTTTGASVHCLIPAIDTRARVIDCLTRSGYNSTLFTIDDIATRDSLKTIALRTTVYTGMDIRLTRVGAQILNRELSSTAFSSSVRVATGELIVTTPTQQTERPSP